MISFHLSTALAIVLSVALVSPAFGEDPLQGEIRIRGRGAASGSTTPVPATISSSSEGPILTFQNPWTGQQESIPLRGDVENLAQRYLAGDTAVWNADGHPHPTMPVRAFSYGRFRINADINASLNVVRDRLRSKFQFTSDQIPHMGGERDIFWLDASTISQTIRGGGSTWMNVCDLLSLRVAR